MRRSLRTAGFDNTAIDAVWPAWWSEDAERSPSAVTELRFTLARRLGLTPSSLERDQPTFVWRDRTKFKNLGTSTDQEQSILASFGNAVGRALFDAQQAEDPTPLISADDLRSLILQQSEFVTLYDLLSFCWAIKLPVAYLSVFPLDAKRMHAMAVEANDRYAILLARKTAYAAQVAYLIAHELGHIFLGHVSGNSALLDVDDPLTIDGQDDEESSADAYALTLLTGEASPDIQVSVESFSASQLAAAVQTAGIARRIDPGTLALCAGHATGKWPQAFGALKIIENNGFDPAAAINAVASDQLDFDDLTSDRREYLTNVLGIDNEQ